MNDKSDKLKLQSRRYQTQSLRPLPNPITMNTNLMDDDTHDFHFKGWDGEEVDGEVVDLTQIDDDDLIRSFN